MLPPPRAVYDSREDSRPAAQSWSRGQGNAVTIKRSVTSKSIQLTCNLEVQTCSMKKDKGDRQRVVV